MEEGRGGRTWSLLFGRHLVAHIQVNAESQNALQRNVGLARTIPKWSWQCLAPGILPLTLHSFLASPSLPGSFIYRLHIASCGLLTLKIPLEAGPGTSPCEGHVPAGANRRSGTVHREKGSQALVQLQVELCGGWLPKPRGGDGSLSSAPGRAAGDVGLGSHPLHHHTA